MSQLVRETAAVMQEFTQSGWVYFLLMLLRHSNIFKQIVLVIIKHMKHKKQRKLMEKSLDRDAY